MANIAPPNKQTSAAKETKVVNLKATEKPSPVASKPLQFMVAETMKSEFKVIAAKRNIKLTELFIEMFEEYKANHENM